VVTFLTLFIGVVSGLQTVQVAVTPLVARVELRLNGEQVATMRAPVWKTTLSLDDKLTPSVLEAVAYNRGGAEIGRDRQLINLPQRQAGARIVPEIDPSGRVEAARVIWEAPAFPGPRRVAASLDGKPAPFQTGYQVELSGIRDHTVHVLSVEISFSDTVSVHRTLVFGAGNLRATSSELTAVPVVLTRGKMPGVAGLQGYFTANGAKLKVDSMERGPSTVVFVRDVGVAKRIWLMRVRGTHSGLRPGFFTFGTLGRRDFVQVEEVVPHVQATGSRTANVFPVSAPVRPIKVHGLGWLLAVWVPFHSDPFGRRLADAVAVAGMTAARGGRRRAVVLCLGDASGDLSSNSVTAVRSYLETLRVPLEVWDFREKKTREEGDVSPWGGTIRIGSRGQFLTAVKMLRRKLARQRIVWLVGEHLPQEIALGLAPRGIKLAE